MKWPVPLAAALLLAGCYQVGSLEGTQVEQIRVEGRLFQVRLRPTGAPNEWRMQINRATMVIGPDLELEGDRARAVARSTACAASTTTRPSPAPENSSPFHMGRNSLRCSSLNAAGSRTRGTRS
jgi:hypothetical protein